MNIYIYIYITMFPSFASFPNIKDNRRIYIYTAAPPPLHTFLALPSPLHTFLTRSHNSAPRHTFLTRIGGMKAIRSLPNPSALPKPQDFLFETISGPPPHHTHTSIQNACFSKTV